MNNTKIGFIGLGNVGGKLAGSLARNGIDLTVRDLNSDLEQPFVANGAATAASPADMVRNVDVVITCLPSPAGSAHVDIWRQMSTTDAAEIQRLGALVEARGGMALDCPVSGGCHRAETGDISI